MPRFPKIRVDLSKATNGFDLLGKVHGGMKHHHLPREIRDEFTHEMYATCKQSEEDPWSWIGDFQDWVDVCKRWVTVEKVPLSKEVV